MQLALGTRHSALISLLVDIMLKIVLEHLFKYVILITKVASHAAVSFICFLENS